ncbi:MAG: hypothetical protein LBG07_12390 [Treponema sp.]|nr:hypothetical protein [Treponema sp.]
MKRCSVFFILAISTLVMLISCGIESYDYLSPIPSGSITSSLNERATITLPSNVGASFTYFALYYRIYISYSARTGFSLSTSDLRDVNPTLYSDYASLSSYTDTSNTTTVNIASVMTNRGYQPLYFEDAAGNISPNALTSQGVEVRLIFPPQGDVPYLELPGNIRMVLKRSDGGNTFNPLPSNRYFLNSGDLNSSGNISSTINADVVAPSGSGVARHAFVAIYIAAAGINKNFTPIFSIPSFVGIFKLADI